MIVTVLADTHLERDIGKKLPGIVLRAIDEADVVLHAGDISSAIAFAELSDRNRIVAVLGNNDRDLVAMLPESRTIDLEGLQIAMVHNSGAREGRAARLHRLFPEADIVIFGHSHVPWDESGLAGQLLFNPGSPTQRRGEPQHSFGRLVIHDGALVEHRIDRF